MAVHILDVVLRKRADGNWETEALSLPTARLVAVFDKQNKLSFEVRSGAVVVKEGNTTSPVARIELQKDLIAASALEQSKLDLEREKIASSELLARRTLFVSVVTAVLSAGATIAVATIANLGGKGEKPQPVVYRELNECRDGLDNLKTLSALDQQTQPDLRAAVRRQADTCIERLRAAMAASGS
jgi:hypothetical protein